MELNARRGVMAGRFLAACAASAACAALALGSVGCSSASDVKSYVEDDALMIDWDGAGAGLYVTDQAAVPPTGPDDKVEGGVTFWAIEATSWPGGFDAPVKYGVLPEDAKDVTEENGGKAGGVPLEKGTTYKITIQGFGGDPTVKEITW